MIGIYKITSPSKKIYIGQSIDIDKRFLYYKQLKCKYQTRLYNSFKKHGVDKHKFEIIVKCEPFELNDKERYYQDLYSVTNKDGLNCRLTESLDRTGEFSTETKLKMSLSGIGKSVSPETRLKISLSSKGKMKSDFTKNKIKQSLLNRTPNEIKKSINKMIETRKIRFDEIYLRRVARGKIIMSDETKEKIRQSKLNMSDEYRMKLSIANTGKKATQETLLRLSISHANQTNENLRVPVIQLDLHGNFIKEFVSVAEAAREVGGNVSKNPNIVKCLKGKGLTALGFKWKYKIEQTAIHTPKPESKPPKKK